jgi:hypothetical protein
MEVYNVHYEDCDTPWVICRHKDAPMSIEKMIDNFGRLPVRLRNLVRVQLGMPAAPSSHLSIPWCAGISSKVNIELGMLTGIPNPYSFPCTRRGAAFGVCFVSLHPTPSRILLFV